MTSSLYERFGALTLPVTATDVTSTLAPLDPGRDVLLGLFQQAIVSELGGAWNQVKPATVLNARSVVQHALPLEPTAENLRTLITEFPLLAVYRTGQATFEQHTLELWRLTQPWNVDYILGPLAIEDQRRLCDVLPAVAKVVTTAVERRGHPDYESGALQFFDGAGKFTACAVKSYELGPMRAGGGDDSAVYWACSMRLETVEIEEFREGYSEVPLIGAAFTFGVGDDDEILPDAIIADTDAVVP